MTVSYKRINLGENTSSQDLTLKLTETSGKMASRGLKFWK
nr:MAG TPA: hypothetical protein [Caudoviricetes sp.]